MNGAVDLIDQVFKNGGDIWLEDGTARVKLPKRLTAELAPQLRQHKAEIIDLLQARARRLSDARARVTVWNFCVDGKRITSIDPERLSETDYRAVLDRKFGPERVSDLRRQ